MRSVEAGVCTGTEWRGKVSKLGDRSTVVCYGRKCAMDGMGGNGRVWR